MERQCFARCSLAAMTAAVLLSVAGSAEAVVQVNTTVHPDDIGRLTNLVEYDPGQYAQLDYFTFLGTYEGFSGSATGAPMPAITANFHGSTRFEFSVSAPAGQQYQVTLPAGTIGGFNFVLDYNAGGITLVPSSAVSMAVDGVPLGVLANSSGIDPTGDSLLVVGSHDPADPIPSSFTFQTLTIALDYPIDSNGDPLIIDDVTHTLNALSNSYVTFLAASLDVGGTPTITLVPEPTSLALLGLGSLLLTRRRRV